MPVRSDLPPHLIRFPADDAGTMPVDSDDPVSAPVASNALRTPEARAPLTTNVSAPNSEDHFESGDSNELNPRTSSSTPAPVSTRSEGSGHDSARFSDGRHHYSWDLRHSEHGDLSGRLEGGTRVGNTEVSLRSDIDEATGDGSHEVRARAPIGDDSAIDGSLRIGSNVESRLELGGETELGDHVHAHGRVTLREGQNPSLRGGVEVEGNAGTLRGEIDVRNGEFHTATIEARHEGDHGEVGGTASLDPEGELRGELDARGRRDFNDGRTRAEGRMRGSINGSESRFEGDARLEHRMDNGVSISERVDFRDGDARFEHGLSYDDNGNSIRGSVSHGLEGDGHLEIEGRIGSSTARLSVEGDPYGLEAGNVSAEHRFAGGSRVSGELDLDEDGIRSGTVRGSTRLNEHVRFTENATLNRDGGYRAEHRVDVTAGGSLSANASVSHGSDEDVRVSAELRRSVGDTMTTVSGNFDTGTGDARARVTHGSGGFSGDVSIGRDRGNRIETEANVRYSGASGSVDAGATYRSREGVTFRANGTTDIGDTNLRAGIDANLGRGTLGGTLGGSRSILDDRATLGGTARLRTDRRGTEAGANVSTTLNNFMGLGALTPSLDGSLRLEKLRLAKPTLLDAGIRETIISNSPDTAFVTASLDSRFSGGIKLKIPVGPGSVEGGYTGSKNYRVELTRRMEESVIGTMPNASDIKVPLTAEGLSSFSAGEGFKITGKTTHAFRGGARLGKDLSAGGPVTVSASAGGRLDYAISGTTTTEVIKGNNGTAIISVVAADNRELGAGFDVKIGASPDIGSIVESETGMSPDALGPVGGLATSLAKDVVTRIATIGIDISNKSQDGERKLLSARLDLKDAKVRAAYNDALNGDWRQLNDLDAEGYPGVDIEKSIASDIDKEVKPVVLSGLGLRYENTTTTTDKISAVITNGERAIVESVSDVSHRRTQNWFDDRSVTVEDFNREVEIEGSNESDVQSWLVWTYTHRDSIKSSSEAGRDLGLVEYLAGPQADVDAYRAKIRALPRHRKMWLGPRNELRNTLVQTRIEIDREGLERLKNLSADDLWSRIDLAAEATSSQSHFLSYLSAEKREDFRTGHVIYGVDDFAYLTFLRYEAVIEKLEAASKLEHDGLRIDAFREALASMDDPVIMAALVDIIGHEDAKVSLKVDSSADDGRSLDFTTSIVGSEYQNRSRLYGEDL